MKYIIMLVTMLLITSCYAAPSMAATDMQPQCEQASIIAQYVADRRQAGYPLKKALSHVKEESIRELISIVYSLDKEVLPHVGQIVYTQCMRKYNQV